jgi:putative FmdB family regulatory protein
MPIYDYECNQCSFRFEKKQSFNDEPLETCPQCQGKLRRIIHSSPILFKGSGFYVTDSRHSGGSKEASKSSD